MVHRLKLYLVRGDHLEKNFMHEAEPETESVSKIERWTLKGNERMERGRK